MVTLIFLWGVSEYILINILTYDPGGVLAKSAGSNWSFPPPICKDAGSLETVRCPDVP